jgi:hypothetical protein
MGKKSDLSPECQKFVKKLYYPYLKDIWIFRYSNKKSITLVPLFNVFTKHNTSSSVHLLQHYKRHVEIKRCSQ